MKLTSISILPLVFYCAHATVSAPEGFLGWADKQYKFSLDKMFSSITPKPDAYAGTIMASPTIIKPNPDYYYHWVRDASLTMDAIAGLTEDNVDDQVRMKYFAMAGAYNNLTAHLQAAPIPEKFKNDPTFDKSQWLGEPKWNMNGTAFQGDWMRPQNDGPATRASAVARFTRIMLHRYQNNTALFYSNTTVTPLMRDLDYTAANWHKPSYEIWEEVKGNHFYTYMAQRRAMLEGAALAQRLKDVKNARKYRQVAKAIEREIKKFWSPSKGYITITKRRVAGLKYKKSELDSQIVLASLHASREDDGFYTPESDQILATWYNLVKVFSKIYPDNAHHKDRAPAIGRYPEDRYNGFDAPPNGGNGWMLITTGMAECLYRARISWRIAEEFRVTAKNVAFLRYITGNKVRFAVGERVRGGNKKFTLTLDALVNVGDKFLQNVRLHTEKDGMHLSEQWNRVTGKQQGAQDLTWSYVSFVTAYRARQRALIA